MKRLIYIAWILLIVGMFACKNTTVQHQNKESITLRLDKSTFTEKLKTIDNAEIIDIRTPEEYQAGAIEGALNIDFYNDNFEKELSLLDKEQATFIYCQSGGRSGKALQKMRAMNFKEVYELKSGYRSWK